MTVVLSGDIGGTKTLLQLTQVLPSGKLECLARRSYASQAFDDLVPLVRQFWDGSPAVTAACFAIAGPVVDNASSLTNLHWELSRERLATELAVPHVDLLNDFEAVGYGVPVVADREWVLLQDAPAKPQAPYAVIGAGTGLGMAYGIWQGDRYYVYASEGSHADFAPRTATEIGLLQFLQARHERVSIERVVSGRGILAIYEYLREQGNYSEQADIAEAVRAWAADPAHHAGGLIGEAALQKSDPLCEAVMDLFAAAYGAAAGDLALTLLAYGGVYVAGGIAAKILPLLQAGGFMDAFHTKGRLSPLLYQMPVKVILNPEVGLLGATQFAAQSLP